MITKDKIYKQIEELCKDNNLGSTFNYVNNPSIFNDEFMDSIIKMFKHYSLQNNITAIYLSNNSLTRFSLEGFPNLTEIHLTGNKIESITIPSCSKIKKIYISNNPLSDQCKKELQEIIDTCKVEINFDGMKAKLVTIGNKAEMVINNEKNSVTEKSTSLSIVYTDEGCSDINVDNILDAYMKCNNLSQKLKNSKDNIDQSELEFLNFLANSCVMEKLSEILINKFEKYACGLQFSADELAVVVKQIKVVELHDSFILSTNEKLVEYKKLKLTLDECLGKTSSYKNEGIDIPLLKRFRCSEIIEKLKNTKNNSCAKQINLQPKPDKDAFYKGFLLRQQVESTGFQPGSNFHKNASVKQVVNANNGVVKPKENLSYNNGVKTTQTNNISVQRPVANNKSDSKSSLLAMTDVFKINQSLRSFATSGENNNCAFHAIFGTWNEKEKYYYCDNAKFKRQVIAANIENADSSVSYKDDIVESIKALIMEQLNNIISYCNERNINNTVISMNGNEYAALSAVMWQYYNFNINNKQKMQEYDNAVLDIINNNDEIKKFLHSCFPSKDIKTAFSFARNELKKDRLGKFEELIDNANLQDLLHKLDKENNKSFDFNQIINDKYVLQEYADIFRNNIMLLPSELALIAKIFNINIEYYINANGNGYICQDKYLCGNEHSETVKILFNGINHYERLIDYSTNNSLSHEQPKSLSLSILTADDQGEIKMNLDSNKRNNIKRQREILGSYLSSINNSLSYKNGILMVKDLICGRHISSIPPVYYSNFISIMKESQREFIHKYKITDTDIALYGDKYFSDDGLKILLHYYASKITQNGSIKFPMFVENAFAFKSIVQEIVRNERSDTLIILNLIRHSWEEEGEYCKKWKDDISDHSCYLAVNLLKKDKNLHVAILDFNEQIFINGISELINSALKDLETKPDTNLIIYKPKTPDKNSKITLFKYDLNLLAVMYAQILKVDSICAAIYNANNHVGSEKISLSRGVYELKYFDVGNVEELKIIAESADLYRITCASISLIKNMDSFLQEQKLSKDIGNITEKYVLTYEFSGANKQQRI